MRIVLASNSPRRKELLHQIFDEFDIVKSNFDEDEVKEKEPEKLVQILSLKKAEEVFNRIQNKENELIVIGGDTLVYFDGQVLGKPKDERDAFDTLKKLQGNKNKVYSAFTIIFKKDNKTIKETYLSKSTVIMKAMSDEEIEKYIKTGEPMDKAGSYAVQGIGSKFIEKIEGSYSSVVGLDVEKLKEILKKYV
ncbi:MAG: septum formation protein Maf [Clostridia bacterium]|nr:septum formation protein Maf [Clostridia bacterium]